jgi:hypothetical protein
MLAALVFKSQLRQGNIKKVSDYMSARYFRAKRCQQGILERKNTVFQSEKMSVRYFMRMQ